MQNIEGVFEIDVAGATRKVKVSFGMVERLERRIIKRPLADLLIEASQARQYVSDVVAVIHEGLVEAGDTRLSLSALGDAVIKEGPPKFAEIYVNLLVYALTGGVPADPASPNDAKKNVTT